MKFWDLLSTRYADPFPVVDVMIENEMLPEFIDNLLEQVNEDKLWQLYLAVALLEEKSFSEWKADILQSPSAAKGTAVADMADSRKELTPEEAVAQAESILSGFKPF